MDFLNFIDMGKMLYAQAEGAQPGSQGFSQILFMLVMFFAIMYFLIIRPQQKRERQRREMLESLSKGDEVVTTGGICGTLVGLNESHVVLRVDDNTKIEFVRSAIAQVTPKSDNAKQD